MSPSNSLPAKSVILSFPEEFLDQICEEMARLKKDSITALSAWIRTCRTFVSSGERALYPNPIRSPAQLSTVSRAQAFLRTLDDRPDLGDRVRNLQHLAHATEYLDDLAPAFQQYQQYGRAAFDAFRWQRDVVECSREVEHVSVYLWLQGDAEDMGRALSAVSRLQKLVVLFAQWDYTSYGRVFCTFLQVYGAERASVLRVPAVQLILQGSQFSAIMDDTSTKPFSTTHLCVDFDETDISVIEYLLPDDTTSIKSLKVTLALIADPSDVYTFFDALCCVGLASLESLVYMPSDAATGSLFPESAFSSYPHLRELTLKHGAGMTLHKLHLLVETSPNLKYLNLNGTTWSISPLCASSPSLDTQVRRSLARLPRLRRAILGYYPGELSDGAEPSGVSGGEAAENGAEVVWQREGEVHDEAE
ncbi:hypothetical protein JCM8097_006705 [Rhodosporidiobolus ruineniae]